MQLLLDTFVSVSRPPKRGGASLASGASKRPRVVENQEQAREVAPPVATLFPWEQAREVTLPVTTLSTPPATTFLREQAMEVAPPVISFYREQAREVTPPVTAFPRSRLPHQ